MKEQLTGDEPVQPTILRQTGDNEFRIATPRDLNEGLYLSDKPGLTIRQHFAAQAMIGVLAAADMNNENGSFVNNGFIHLESVAKDAVELADALIKELNKPTQS